MSRARPHGGLLTFLPGVLVLAGGIVLNPWTMAAWLTIDGEIESPLVRMLLAGLSLGSVAAGALLLWRRPRITGRDLALSLGSVLFTLLLLEGALRLGAGAYLAPGYQGSQVYSDTLGWMPIANLRRTFHTDLAGRVEYSTGPLGFRRFGDPEATRTKVLFIGDSFTQAAQVSDGQAYYDHIAAQRPDLEIFAFGAGGYGSLQEYLVLERVIDLIRPDVIVWQFCSNDIINNDFLLESSLSLFNNHMRRPYYEDGGVVYRFPHRIPLVRHSALGRFLLPYVQLLELRTVGNSYERMRDSAEEYFAARPDLYARGVRPTSGIMALVRERTGEIPVVAFSVDEPYLNEGTFEEISVSHGIRFIGGVPAAVAAAKKSGVRVDFGPYDSHWSQDGHSVAAQVILEYLNRGDLPPREAPGA